jgi:hypothetical protein
MTRLEWELLTGDGETAAGPEKTPDGIDPDGLLAYLRETTQACLDPVALAEGEFPDRFLSNALEALTTFAALDAWLSGGGRPPFAWTRMWHRPPSTVPAAWNPAHHTTRKDPTP